MPVSRPSPTPPQSPASSPPPKRRASGTASQKSADFPDPHLDPMTTELIGWIAAIILLATIARQVYSQWRDRTSLGVSKRLFVGQIMASVGFVVYSWLLRNWVFLVTNVLMLGTALLGQWIYLHNKRCQKLACKRRHEGAGVVEL